MSMSLFDQLLDTFLHLPTLLVAAIIAGVIVWQVYGIGFSLSGDFIQVTSNQGSLILSWQDGCCELNW